MTDKLKPCPFCGNEYPSIACDKDRTVFQPHCLCCEAKLGYYDTKEEAIAAWNKRQGENDAKELCAKLNRLAALEAVYQEIVESAPRFASVVDNEDVQIHYLIAQKLKAVLEEK